MKLIYTILLLSLSFSANAQKRVSKAKTKTQAAVIRHTDKSLMPDSINVIGTLATTWSPGLCGMFCAGGTIKVRLKNKIPGYDHEFVYLVTACLSESVSSKSKVDVIATKLRIKEKECYYQSIINIFDSKGIPFYKLSEKETSKIH